MDSLIETAINRATEIVTITRCDGSTYQGARNYGSAEDGEFQVYVVPVEQRTRAQKPHYRSTFYLMMGGQYRRVSRSTFVAKMVNA